jgi:nitrate/nitrite transporter NarK
MIVKRLYPASSETIQNEEESLVTALAMLGAVIGQLAFGVIADQIGRRQVSRLFLCGRALICIVLSGSTRHHHNQKALPMTKLVLFHLDSSVFGGKSKYNEKAFPCVEILVLHPSLLLSERHHFLFHFHLKRHFGILHESFV